MRACHSSDLDAIKAAIGSGASVNEMGQPEEDDSLWLTPRLDTPLGALVDHWHWQHQVGPVALDAIRLILSLGADPSREVYGAVYSRSEILQLLIDAGGDVNHKGGSFSLHPIFAAVGAESDGSTSGRDIESMVQVLLAQPRLDLAVFSEGNSPDELAQLRNYVRAADMIRAEVRAPVFPSLLHSYRDRHTACGDCRFGAAAVPLRRCQCHQW